MLDKLGRPARVLLLGGTSEIGLAILAAMRAPAQTRVVLAGRDEQRLEAAGKDLACECTTVGFDALDTSAHRGVIDEVFAEPVDLVIAATGLLTPQEELDQDPVLAARMIEVNFTSHVTTLLAAADHMRAQGAGTIVILSSVAAVRPRKANYVYGAAKAGLDAFGRGLTDALAGTGVRVLLVRPGFVIGRMTAGMSAAPMSSTPAQVGSAVAAALCGKHRQCAQGSCVRWADQRPLSTLNGRASVVWVPRGLAMLAVVLRLVPRPLWRRMRR